MDILISALVVLNFTLGTALFVVTIARLDQRHAARARDTQEYKSHFRGRHWD